MSARVVAETHRVIVGEKSPRVTPMLANPNAVDDTIVQFHVDPQHAATANGNANGQQVELAAVGENAHGQVVDKSKTLQLASGVVAQPLLQHNTLMIDGRGRMLLPGTFGYVDGPVLSLHPETLRIIAYASFWIMVALAAIVTKVWVTGVDFENTPLVAYYGYNNVCILWDYEPATTVIAMFYPMVEIPLCFYCFLNYLRVREAYYVLKRMAPWKFYVCTAMFPIEFILLIWFRMIFVVKAFEDTIGHTLGFHALMLALIMVALENFLYYDSLGNDEEGKPYLPGPRWASIGYLIILWCVTWFKLIVGWAIFAGTPLWSVRTTSGQRASQGLDILWMILASVTPCILAWFNRQRTPSMVLSYATAPKGVL